MQELKTSYERMSESGRAVAEFIELTRRHEVVTLHSDRVFGLKNAPKTRQLASNLQARYAKLADAEKRAATAFCVRHHQQASRPDLYGGDAWKQWLSAHLQTHPNDAVGLYLVESIFSHQKHDEHRDDYQWQMVHEW